MAKQIGSFMIPSTHPRFNELRSKLGAKGTKYITIHPGFEEYDTLKASLNSNNAVITPEEPKESLSEKEQIGIVNDYFASRLSLSEAHKDLDEAKKALEQRTAMHGTSFGLLRKVVADGETFRYHGRTWLMTREGIKELTEARDFDAVQGKAPPAKRKKGD